MLQTFTTTKMITLVTKEATGAAGPAPVVSSSADAAPPSAGEAGAPSDKTASRLAQLDDTAEGTERKVLQMSQKEYTNHIRHLNEELKVAWQHDERVKAIKIAIQTSKFLSDPSVPQFYPSMFVLVAEVLDTFGRLVYSRISSRAAEISGFKLPDSFAADDVPAEARETCRNWFYKIASIRELIPRVYVELAMLGSYRFIAERGDFPVILARIVAMIRGVGNPLVAAYARMYLAHIGITVAPWAREYLVANATDLMLLHTPQLSPPAPPLPAAGVLFPLLTPAITFTLRCAGHRAARDVFFALADRMAKHAMSAAWLAAVLSCFHSDVVATHAVRLLPLVKTCDYTTATRASVLIALIGAVTTSAPPAKDRLVLLSEIWRAAKKLTDLAEFTRCSVAFLPFVTTHFSAREVATVLGDVHSRLGAPAVRAQLQPLLPLLHPLLSSLLARYSFARVLRFPAFMPLVALFRGEREIARSLLRGFVGSAGGGGGGDGDGTAAATATAAAAAAAAAASSGAGDDGYVDGYVVQMLFECARAVAEGEIERVTTEAGSATGGDTAAMSLAGGSGGGSGSVGGGGGEGPGGDEALLRAFVLRVGFGNDLERHLAFLVDARAAMTGLDTVQAGLVHAGCALAMRALRVVRGRHTKRTLGFAKACVGFCFITVPSITDPLARMSLYTLTAQVALCNGLSAQAEACLRGAVTCIPDVPHHYGGGTAIRPTDPALATRLQVLVGTLVSAPGHPEQGPYFVVNGLAKAVAAYAFAPGSVTGLHCRCDLIQVRWGGGGGEGEEGD
jgi:hypothetical protein